jgi:hypothetical protein
MALAEEHLARAHVAEGDQLRELLPAALEKSRSITPTWNAQREEPPENT